MALQVAHYYLRPAAQTRLAAAANLDGEKLRNYLQEVERGGLFVHLGVRNFLEGDFFGWYLDIWDDNLDVALRRLIADLGNYSLLTLDVDPEETRDLLKKLYQNLMPRKLRHALGEYYTPDWLAERVLNQLGYEGDPSKRLLDPACGSGTFLVLAIKRVRGYAEEHKLSPSRVLDQVLSNIVGYDLNPLAVITARTNYLLALGDLLPRRHGEISIPVYLADSILTPSEGATETGQTTYLEKKSPSKVRRPGFGFNTAVGPFVVPRSLVDARYIDQLADLLEESVRNGLTAAQFKTRLLDSFPLDPAKDGAEVSVAIELYEQLLDLDRQHINGIWARIIKNAFAPLFQGRFDYVAGNPPWVVWQNLPADYRESTVCLWNHYRLLDIGTVTTRQVSSRVQADISVMMFYVSIDRYLHPGGRLGFVITQSIFRSVVAGRGFRRFELPQGQRVKVLHVDDFTQLQPFEGATNLTSVIVVELGRPGLYPVPYTLWRRRTQGSRIPPDAALAETSSLTRRYHLAALPIDETDSLSPWLIGRQKAIKQVRRHIGRSPYHDLVRKGSDTRGANGVFWLRVVQERPDGPLVVSNLAEAGRREAESIQTAIEPDLVYPLLRGQEVQRWSARPQSHILVPHSPGRASYAIPQSELSIRYPKTYGYLRHFEAVLRGRPAFRNFDPSQDTFYMLYNVGTYTFADYKVVWREQAQGLTVAVAEPSEGKPVVPDHKLSAVPTRDLLEAHFVCAALNSRIVEFIVKSYALGTSIDTHVLNYVNVPKWDPENPIHQELSELSRQAHVTSEALSRQAEAELRDHIDDLVAQLWGLVRDELKEIQESLAELE